MLFNSLLYSMCLCVRSWWWTYLVYFPICNSGSPIKNPNSLCHSNMLSTSPVTYQNWVTHWQHWYVILLGDINISWVTRPVLWCLDSLALSHPITFSSSHSHNNILVLVFTWKCPTSFILYTGIFSDYIHLLFHLLKTRSLQILLPHNDFHWPFYLLTPYYHPLSFT